MKKKYMPLIKSAYSIFAGLGHHLKPPLTLNLCTVFALKNQKIKEGDPAAINCKIRKKSPWGKQLSITAARE